MITSLADLVNWKGAKKATLIIYLVVIILIPFNQKIAAILLFSLLCFWSRLVTMLNDYIKDLDVIDFFSVLISINIGALQGAVFAFLNLSIPRFFGRVEPIAYVFKDAVAMAVAALLTPIVYSLTHQNLLLTMYIYTVMRYVFYLAQTISFDRSELGLDITYCFIGPWIAYFMNTIMVKVFGGALDEVFKKGIVVSKELFLFVTIVILIYISISYIVKKVDDKEEKQQPVEKESVESTAPEPWQVPIMLMTASNDNFMVIGTRKQFIFKSILMVFLLAIIPFFAIQRSLTPWYVMVAVIFSYIVVNLFYYIFNTINENVKRNGLTSIVSSISLLSFFTLILSFIS